MVLFHGGDAFTERFQGHAGRLFSLFPAIQAGDFLHLTDKFFVLHIKTPFTLSFPFFCS